MPESKRRNEAEIGALWGWVGGYCLPKMELEVRSKSGTRKCEEDEIKRVQKWSRKSRNIVVRGFQMFPRPFPAKRGCESTGKVQNALRSKSKSRSKSAAVHQKETKLNEKGRSARKDITTENSGSQGSIFMLNSLLANFKTSVSTDNMVLFSLASTVLCCLSSASYLSS